MIARRGRLLATTTMLAVGVAVWMTFAPVRLGGSSSYALVNGSSMEPYLHAGDLAIIREQDEYRKGDVIAYHSDQLDTLVLHRIVEHDEGVLVTQGDNNDWVDPDRPEESDVLGSLRWRVPGAGRVLSGVNDPLAAAIAVGLLTVVILGFGLERVPERAASRSEEDVETTTRGHEAPVAVD